MKKNILFILATIIFLTAGPQVASAEHSLSEQMTEKSPAELEHILKDLQAQLALLQAGKSITVSVGTHTPKSCHIEKNIGDGASGDDVECLQKFLVEKGKLALPTPTGHFGTMTKKAVMVWQEHVGLPETGYFGEMSREKWKHEHDAEHSVPVVADHHAMIEATTPVPVLALTVTKDAMDGFNVFVDVQNFRFAPEHASQAHVAGEGHMHINVDGKKLGRMYSPWYHVPVKSLGLTSGHHKIRVDLATNNHSSYAIGQTPIFAEVEVVVE